MIIGRIGYNYGKELALWSKKTNGCCRKWKKDADVLDNMCNTDSTGAPIKSENFVGDDDQEPRRL